MREDNWADRSHKMKCDTCMWFSRKGGSVLGRCRKNAPTMGGFPAVFDSDWCGAHKLDEASVGPVGGAAQGQSAGPPR